ncbi:gfo/Idh/MocA family oxidoreductase [Aerococcus agrisoli]|uniref:Gfo/Idh/MocA family oxidoreductase n=1 Tax=Aerococcus agrisoli TaxID=2487350 RepID=A0A3N4G4H4_9LACT|nr:Gfo/Idh/MocA family oxidoreductase [Aerococcus agrisoli]RPA57275.1 gfo/Idh/MocA family oxidoreductase [Aerococcus agrisoli]
MLKVAVIGLGTVSIVHIRGIQASAMADLVAVCDIDSSKADLVPDATFYTDYKTMLAEEDLDVVHVCLPHYLHDTVTLDVAKKGIHVLCEKPVSVNYERSKALADAVDELNNGVKVAICFQNRLNASVIELKRILTEEDTSGIIAVKGLVAWYRGPEYYAEKPWRGTIKEAGSGTIINQSIHTLDLLHYVMDAEWTDVRASVHNILDYDIEVEDSANANFTFSNGAHGLFYATNAYYGNDSVELQVVTNKSRYTIKDNKLFDDDWHCLAEDAKIPDSKIYYGPGHQDCMEEFYTAITANTDKYCSIRDALPTMQMIDAMKASSATQTRIYKEAFLNG